MRRGYPPRIATKPNVCQASSPGRAPVDHVMRIDIRAGAEPAQQDTALRLADYGQLRRRDGWDEGVHLLRDALRGGCG